MMGLFDIAEQARDARLGRIRIPLKHLADALVSGRSWRCRTTHMLPDGARVVDVFVSASPTSPPMLEMVLEHPAFARIREGERIVSLGEIVLDPVGPEGEGERLLPGLRLLQGRLARLEVQPGDTLVMMADGPLPAADREAIEAQLMQIFPGHKAICIEGGLTLGAVNVPQLQAEWEAHHRGPEPAVETQGAHA